MTGDGGDADDEVSSDRDAETSRRMAMVVIARPATPEASQAISEPSSSVT